MLFPCIIVSVCHGMPWIVVAECLGLLWQMFGWIYCHLLLYLLPRTALGEWGQRRAADMGMVCGDIQTHWTQAEVSEQLSRVSSTQEILYSYGCFNSLLLLSLLLLLLLFIYLVKSRGSNFCGINSGHYHRLCFCQGSFCSWCLQLWSTSLL